MEFSLLRWRQAWIIRSYLLYISSYDVFLCVLFQRVPLAPTRCPPGSRSVFPVRPTVSQRRKDLWCVCVRRTTSEPPWTHPQHHARVTRLYMFIFVCVCPHHSISLMHCIISSRHFCIKWAISCLEAIIITPPTQPFTYLRLPVAFLSLKTTLPLWFNPSFTPHPFIPLFSSHHPFVWPAPTSP